MLVMGERRVAIVNGRALAAAMWLLESVGHHAKLGDLEGMQRREDSDGATGPLVSEVISWASQHGAAAPSEIAMLATDTEGLESFPAVRAHLLSRELDLNEWLGSIWPGDATLAEPASMPHLHWLLRRRFHQPQSETFLVVPIQRMNGYRIGSSTYVVSRDLVTNGTAFRGWARRRRRLEARPLTYWLDSASNGGAG